jgi:hypothetical protein
MPIPNRGSEGRCRKAVSRIRARKRYATVGNQGSGCYSIQAPMNGSGAPAVRKGDP